METMERLVDVEATEDGTLVEELEIVCLMTGLKRRVQVKHPSGAPGRHACDCGHPEMRRLLDGGLRCPACGPEEPATLTGREEEIAALIARGSTNRQISAELEISELAVASHVRKILKKLRLRLRAQIAERQLGRKDRP